MFLLFFLHCGYSSIHDLKVQVIYKKTMVGSILMELWSAGGSTDPPDPPLVPPMLLTQCTFISVHVDDKKYLRLKPCDDDR
ncbi:hypothetical protein HanOQP8_Chr17g0683041 [Helianthus annuus]|nr:hypothetical protein HanOQP8_Chr17g0683041 [Helianthus annuus]